jgi:hydrogenase maturation factor
MNGAELAARYAFPPNSKGYCGRPTFAGALMAGRRLKKELKKFPVHYGYLSLIARANGKKPFDMAVVRAFWTGNRLLDGVRPSAVRSFIRRIIKNPARAKKLIANLPAGAVPHHSFNALYVNFATGKAARSVRNYDSCCVTFGKILSVSRDSAVVRRLSITRKAGRLALVQKTARVALEKNGIRFAGALKKGDVVSIHWGMAIERLAPEQSAALKRYTLKNISAVNGAARR